MLRSLFLLLTLLLSFFSKNLAAIEVKDLYQATVNVDSQASAQREQAVQSALAGVFLKVGGKQGISNNPVLKKAQKNASRYVSQYRYQLNDEQLSLVVHFNEDKVRYHKVIIMTDADVDGSHIQTLLLTFFFRFLRPVIDSGYLYIAQPPLYRYKKGKNETYLKDNTALSNFLIGNGLESFEFEGMGYNDLLDMFKTVAAYRAMLANLEKRYSLVEVLKHFVENKELVGLEFSALFVNVEAFLLERGYNILSKTVTENKIHIFVQTKEGLEELLIDDELFSSPYFTEAIYIFDKLNERDLSLFEGKDLIDLLNDIEAIAKKGAYIQRYKGLGEMNPEQLWETTMIPEARRLLRVKVEDAEIASDTFTLFMGDEVEPRRNYIVEHAKDVEHLDV